MRNACTAFGRWREIRSRRLERSGMAVGKIMDTRASLLLLTNAGRRNAAPLTSEAAVLPSRRGARHGATAAEHPDVTVDCGRRDPGNLVLPQPTVVVEVLSPDTQRLDRTIKLAEYNATSSIRHYVLIEPSEPLVNIYDRHQDGDFNLRPREVRELDGTIELPGISLTLAMNEVYEGLEFGLEPDAKAPGNAACGFLIPTHG